MKRAFAIRLAAAAVALAAALPQAASAKDWIEKVQVSKDGIDVIPIEVSANSSGYTGIKTSTHKFGLRLYARATNGERIVAMKLGSYHGVLYFEYQPSGWNTSYDYRDVGSGSKRTVDLRVSPSIPVGKLAWQGSDPRAACAANLQNLVAKGTNKTVALGKVYTITAYAYFELDAVAAHKNKAIGNDWNLGNTTDQRHGMAYPVSVKCLAGATLKSN